jgi:hypothetical protein
LELEEKLRAISLARGADDIEKRELSEVEADKEKAQLGKITAGIVEAKTENKNVALGSRKIAPTLPPQ